MRIKRLLLFTLLSLLTRTSSTEKLLGKCCPPGEIFSGKSKVDCVPAPWQAMELYRLDYGRVVNQDGFPRCDEPEDVSTTRLDALTADDFLQVPACLEILHEQTYDESVPIVVHCRSNKDRDKTTESLNASLPSLLDVRRCCPKDTFFDRGLKTCVPVSDIIGASNYSEINDFVSLLPKELESMEFLRIIRGSPECNETLFDYEIPVEDIVFDNETLQVTLPSLVEDFNEKIAVTKDNACLELTPESSSKRKLLLRVCRSAELCERNTCIRKCCPEDEFYFFAIGCSKVTTGGKPIGFHQTVLNITNDGDTNIIDYGLLVGTLCRYGMYPLSPEDKWSLSPEGYLRVLEDETYQHHQYCMEILYNTTDYEETVHPLVCFPDPRKELEAMKVKFTINTILEGTSCIFLLLTLLVYACLPALQNLHGKTLMCHAASLLLAYGCLAIVPWVTPETLFWEYDEEPSATVLCSTIGYIMFFAFLSAFCWLNVMCFDIWRTFGGLRGSSTRGRAHRKRFLLYCLYAWGLASFMTILCILSDQMQILPDYLSPNIGRTSCWFPQIADMYGELVFFIAPITIQLLANAVFFVLTSVHCSKVKAEIRRVADLSDPRSKRFHADKTKLVMNMKLFVVMGISWVTEIISFFLNKYVTNSVWKEELFYASDALNCLQGLLIFILFVLKTRVYLALKRRFGFDRTKRVASQETTALQDPYRVKKSASSTTLTSTFAVSTAP